LLLHIQLKKEFYAPPTPEDTEKERRLISPINRIFLELECKLEEDGMTLNDALPLFDKENKGNVCIYCVVCLFVCLVKCDIM
jgi:hypothetical protein